MVKVEFNREMSPQVVRNKILATFAGQEDFSSSYSILSQSQDGKLSPADNQFPTGEQFVDKSLRHRGNVYLAPRKKEVGIGTNGFKKL